MVSKKEQKNNKKQRDVSIQKTKRINQLEHEMFLLCNRAHDGKGNLVWLK